MKNLLDELLAVRDTSPLAVLTGHSTSVLSATAAVILFIGALFVFSQRAWWMAGSLTGGAVLSALTSVDLYAADVYGTFLPEHADVWVLGAVCIGLLAYGCYVAALRNTHFTYKVVVIAVALLLASLSMTFGLTLLGLTGTIHPFFGSVAWSVDYYLVVAVIAALAFDLIFQIGILLAGMFGYSTQQHMSGLLPKSGHLVNYPALRQPTAASQHDQS